jgi:hypothetical protein
MRALLYFLTTFFILINLSIEAVEIVIKTDKEEEKKEEKKEEPEMELPQPAKLEIRAFNLTKYNYIVTANAQVKNLPYGHLILQNLAQAEQNSTLGSLYAEENTTFELLENEVILHTEDVQVDIKCKIKTIVPEEEISDKEDVKQESKEDKDKEDVKQESKEDKEEKESDHKKADLAPGSDSPDQLPAITKSIDFFLFIPAGDTIPTCAIYFDSKI